MSETYEILLPHIAKGVHAGALRAIEVARQTNTKLVVWIDGKSVEITPDEAEAMAREEEGKGIK